MDVYHKKGHISSLDGVRGIAILLVLFFHCFENITFLSINYISKIGWVGVDLFFVLSGFLITGILIDSKGKKNFLSNFFAKRALRIFPLYYLTLFLFFLVLSIPGITRINPAFNTILYQSSTNYLTFTQNIYFAFNGWGETDILNHFWSLAIEEQFYLFWPFVINYLHRKKIISACFLLIIISLTVRNYNAYSDFSYVFTLSRVDALGIGSMLAILIRDYRKILNKLILPIFFISISILLLILFQTKNLHFRNPYFVRFGYTLFALLFASIIAFIYDTKKIGMFTNRILSVSPLRFFGKYSYGIYIYHWILYKGVYVYLANKYNLPDLFIIPFLLAVILISFISFKYFEKYFLNFKSKLNNTKPSELQLTEAD